jgi:hypothetical protein
MNIFKPMTTVAMAVMLPTSACGESPQHVAKQAQIGAEQEGKVDGEGREVRNLPFARGRTFRSLDEYLAHLEQLGAIDLPYWRRIGPDLYERVTTRIPRGEPERATRAELMEKYGFTR